MNGANLEEDSVVATEALARWLKATGAIVTVVIVAMFVQKGGNHSSIQLLFWLFVASIGVLAAAIGFFGLRYRSHVHVHPLAFLCAHWYRYVLTGAAGVFLIWISFVQLDRSVPDEIPATTNDPAITGVEIRAKDSEQLALRALRVATNSGRTRMSAVILNRTDVPLVVDTLTLDILHVGLNPCAGYGATFHLDNDITVQGTRMTGQVTPDSGVMAGFPLKVGGRLRIFCEYMYLSISVPTNMAVDPHSSVELGFSLPRDLRATVESLTEMLPGISGLKDGDTAKVALCSGIPVALGLSAHTLGSKQNASLLNKFFDGQSPIACDFRRDQRIVNKHQQPGDAGAAMPPALPRLLNELLDRAWAEVHPADGVPKGTPARSRNQ